MVLRQRRKSGKVTVWQVRTVRILTSVQTLTRSSAKLDFQTLFQLLSSSPFKHFQEYQFQFLTPIRVKTLPTILHFPWIYIKENEQEQL